MLYPVQGSTPPGNPALLVTQSSLEFQVLFGKLYFPVLHALAQKHALCGSWMFPDILMFLVSGPGLLSKRPFPGRMSS